MGNKDDHGTHHSNSSRLAIMQLANMISVPMSLNAVVRINVADAIWQNGTNTPLSASEILSRILPAGTSDAENLQRILHLLSSYGGLIRRYSLTEIRMTLVSDENGLSYGPYILQYHQEELMKAWGGVHEAVVDSSSEPLVKANGGETAYGIYGKKPKMNALMQKAMSGVSVPFMKAVLEDYYGSKGVQKLVDVGGNAEDCLRMILEKHDKIKEGVNFDLPEVVAKAPKVDGVTHVGGDMFNYISKGDAIFTKDSPWLIFVDIVGCAHWVLTTWRDDEVKKIMINCFKAIPVGGKLIVCKPVLPDNTDDDNSHRTRALLEGDIFVMAIYRAKGKHRTGLKRSIVNSAFQLVSLASELFI